MASSSLTRKKIKSRRHICLFCVLKTVCALNCHTSPRLAESILKRELSFAWRWGYLSEIETIKARATEISQNFYRWPEPKRKPQAFLKEKRLSCPHIKTKLNICFPKNKFWSRKFTVWIAVGIALRKVSHLAQKYANFETEFYYKLSSPYDNNNRSVPWCKIA